ncbi:MAG: tail fiber protein [Candidatus Sulfotelmatobacter sp.]|jgi:microcystin-dependent protein
MATPYLGEIRMVSFNFPPKGWALCNGQTMAINQNQALFALLGTSYGGDGRTTFLLPDFRGRIPISSGAQPSGPDYTIGTRFGEEQHTLTTAEMAIHSHIPMASTGGPAAPSPSGSFWASNSPQYAASPINTVMAQNAIGNAGGNQPHENRGPYLVISFIIALTGIFPSQN